MVRLSLRACVAGCAVVVEHVVHVAALPHFLGFNAHFLEVVLGLIEKVLRVLIGLQLLLEAEVCAFVCPRLYNKGRCCISNVYTYWGLADLCRCRSADTLDAVSHDLESVSVVPWIDESSSHGASHYMSHLAKKEDCLLKDLDECWISHVIDCTLNSFPGKGKYMHQKIKFT